MTLLLKIAESKRLDALAAYERACIRHRGQGKAWRELHDWTTECLRLELEAAQTKRRKHAA